MADFIYLDNHATTRMDPAVLQAMLPYLQEQYANAGSVTHEFGRQTADDVKVALDSFANRINASAEEIIVTSGATEAANLAIFGVSQHPRTKRRKIVAVKTEHRAVLDPIRRLEESGFEIAWIPVIQQGSSDAGIVDLVAASELIDDKTSLVCVMLVNNEIGVVQPIRELAKMCHEVGALLFCDATAGFGRLAIDVRELDVDLVAFSAHKFYGPKGIGGLFVNARDRTVRLRSQILGGGQQRGFRSGTLNVPGVIGMASALAVSEEVRESERTRLGELQQKFWKLLVGRVGESIILNGPAFGSLRVFENINLQWSGVEGQSLMLEASSVCISSGSACSSAEQTVSHVLTSIGLSQDEARSSTRVGLGRFTTEAEIDAAAELLTQAYEKLIKMRR